MDAIKKIIITIIILIIIICIIMVAITVLKPKQETDDNNTTIEQSFQKANKLETLKSTVEWIKVENCLNMYITYSNSLQMIEEIDEEEIARDKEYYEMRQKQLINIIPDFVKDELNITQENSYTKIASKNETYRISNIYKSVQTISNQSQYEETSNISAYVVEGVFINKQNLEQRDLKMVVLIDDINSTFLIIPNEYLEAKKINLSENNNIQLYTEEKIEKNQSNTFNNKSANNEDICRKYFADYKTNITYDIEFAFESLDKQYREAKFGTLENYKAYIQKNIKEINQAVFKEYMVNNYKDYTEYVCRDQYKNLYIFNETAPMQFTMTFDTFTLPNEKFTTTYQSSNEQEKVMMNIDKWVQMLNNRDYNAAFNVLDETFRQEKFGDVEKFEEYMRTYIPSHYSIEFKNFTDQGQIYVQEIELTDIVNEKADIITKSIIMKLGEGTDFVMSFDI